MSFVCRWETLALTCLGDFFLASVQSSGYPSYVLPHADCVRMLLIEACGFIIETEITRSFHPLLRDRTFAPEAASAPNCGHRVRLIAVHRFPPRHCDSVGFILRKSYKRKLCQRTNYFPPLIDELRRNEKQVVRSSINGHATTAATMTVMNLIFLVAVAEIPLIIAHLEQFLTRACGHIIITL